MSFRARLAVALIAVVLIPLVVVAAGVRGEMTSRLTAEYQRRVEALSAVIRQDLERESASIAGRLSTLAATLESDNRFRAALKGGLDEYGAAERDYVVDYAGRAMGLAGLEMLQLQSEDGRIISSGHFRAEFDRLEPELPEALALTSRGAAIARARTAEGPLIGLVRADTARIGGRAVILVGGTALDSAYLGSLARDGAIRISLELPDTTIASPSAAADSIRSAPAGAIIAAVDLAVVGGGDVPLRPARLVVAHPLDELQAIRRSVDRWFLTALALTLVAALLLALWLARRLGRPLEELAAKTAHLDLEQLDVRFDTDRDDEIGDLARVLGAMTARLRAGAARLREVERRATVGDVARQVNHDIKNGLAPIRNVVRHLVQVAADDPHALPGIFAERQGTLESGIAYLETLAANYARLSPRLDRQPCDANAVARDVVRDASAAAGPAVELRTQLDASLPPVLGDAVVLRRILENLVGNAVESLGPGGGTVTLSSERLGGSGDRTGGSVARLTVADSGRGMTERELAHAFDDFYTTKPTGTGLGLSIVRRLVLDLNGTLRVDTAPGSGTRFEVELPLAVAAAPSLPAPQVSGPVPR